MKLILLFALALTAFAGTPDMNHHDGDYSQVFSDDRHDCDDHCQPASVPEGRTAVMVGAGLLVLGGVYGYRKGRELLDLVQKFDQEGEFER